MSAPENRDLSELRGVLRSDSDARRYAEASNGAKFTIAEQGYGSTVIEVLPELIGLPFNNLVIAYLHALRPSTVRVIRDGIICLDCWMWRVTVFLKDDKVEKIRQEVMIGYGCGYDLEQILKHAKGGPEPQPFSGVIGNTKGLERIDFA